MFPICSFILPSGVYYEGPIKETMERKKALPLLLVSQQNTKVLPLKLNFQTRLCSSLAKHFMGTKKCASERKSTVFPLPSLIFIITRTFAFTRETLFS